MVILFITFSFVDIPNQVLNKSIPHKQLINNVDFLGLLSFHITEFREIFNLKDLIIIYSLADPAYKLFLVNILLVK